MAEPCVITVISQKGGVGKTTIAVNLAVALSRAGKSTLLIDSDLSNPCVGVQLGMQSANLGTADILKRNVDLKEVTSIHAASGLRVIPAVIKEESFYLPSAIEYVQAFNQLLKSKYDFIIVDTAPGYLTPENIGSAKFLGEVLLVATPSMGSLTSVMRSSQFLSKENVKHNLVINRITNERYEFSIEEIEDMYAERAVATIPEDKSVPISVSQHIPAYLSYPRSNFSSAIRGLARHYITKSGLPEEETPGVNRRRGTGIIGFLRNLFGI